MTTNLYDSINRYDLGAVVRVDGVFTDTDAATPLDPATVRLFYLPPGEDTAVELIYGIDGALVRDSTGNFHVDIDADTSGIWAYRWESTGSGQAAFEGRFYVAASLIP